MERPGARWNNLFDDLEGQLEQELGAEGVDLMAEEERLRLGRMSLRDRLLALKNAGAPVRLTITSGEVLPVTIATIGRDWLAGDIADGSVRARQCIVPLFAVAGITLASEQVAASLAAGAAEETGLAARLGLAFILRDLCRRRRAVDVVLGTIQVHGTIDRVGRDHFDLAVHDPAEPRRASAVSHYRVVAFDGLLFVRL